jgi:hypothetical protein
VPWLLEGLCSVGVAALLLLLPSAGAEAQTRRALLIGVNDYERLPALRGSINDVETMKALLVTRYGFAEENVRMITDRQATRSKIFAALNQLVDQARPRDTVYIHYSGHGSQVRDASQDEPDGFDETICPQDARTPDVADITDDELDAIIGRLKVSSAVIVLDSCHSGTGLRDATVDIRARFVPPDERESLYQTSTRAVVPLPLSERYLLFTGAAADQSALDGPFDGQFHGLFTLALSRSLQGAPPGASPRAIMRGVETVLAELKPRLGGRPLPEPQLEGPRDLLDGPLLAERRAEDGTGGLARLPWVEVQPINKGTLRLINGVRLGARVRSIWAVYPPGETRFEPGRALARATVFEHGEADALARPLDAGVPVRPGSRAVLVSPPPAASRVPVLLRKAPASMRSRIIAGLESLLGDGVALVNPGQAARFVIDCESEEPERELRCEVAAAEGGGRLARFRASPDSVTKMLATFIMRSLAVNALVSLDNPSSAIRIEMRAVGKMPPTEQRVGTRGVRVTADLAPHALRFYTPGSERTPETSLQLEISTDRDCYLTIADVDSESRVNLLFPNDYQNPGFLPSGLVPARTSVRIPDSLGSGNRAGFHFDYGPPAGLDTIRAFCTTRLDDARRVRAGVEQIARSSGSGRESVALLRAGFSNLRDELASGSTRGLTGVEAAGKTQRPVTDWAATSITLRIGSN